MAKAKYRGHDIEYIYENDNWIFSDTKTSVSENKNIKCGNCGKPQTSEDHDDCIGSLKNVLNACCGHGNSNEAYIQFSDKSEIRGIDAVKYIKERQ